MDGVREGTFDLVGNAIDGQDADFAHWLTPGREADEIRREWPYAVVTCDGEMPWCSQIT
jgi:hypothetical protein